MIETFALLLFAHVLADFILQTNWMVRTKTRFIGMAAHIAIVWVTLAAVTTMPLHEAVLILIGAHLVIDVVKTAALPNTFASFMADQAAHVASLIVVAAIAPDLWSGSLWAVDGFDWLPSTLILISGFIIATRAGGFAIRLLMTPYAEITEREGLADGGALIGQLERGIVFILILADAPMAIGFLIAAKSILRFKPEAEDQLTEYVIIGTLASFGWALAATFASLGVMSVLPPLPWLP
ncbi:DUF3307 domain-containing protein [Shimia ponticola]|uniref:DUF3307 domain-containing protein n=1 Tax=Shimia ponticola TaxID=2582893 RepID=UPI00164CBB07|nr:DUF3307 domain-containing protein [Shimia ponticola]